MTPIEDAAKARLERVGEEEDSRWRFLRDCLRAGYEAAALSTTDLRTMRPSVLLGDQVEVSVKMDATEGEERVDHLPLSELWRVAVSGAEQIRDIASPTPRPVHYQAAWAGTVSGRTYTSMMIDRRGLGFLTLSDAPHPLGGHGTFGSWCANYAERSGVEEVNERRRIATRDLYKQWNTAPKGKRPADRTNLGKLLVDNIRKQEIIEFYASLPPGWMNEWGIYEDGEPLSLSPLPSGEVTPVSDRVANALCREAWGATKRTLPSANVGSSFDGSIDSSELTREQKKALLKLRVFTEESVPEQRPQMMSEFVLSHRRRDAVGNLATDLVMGYGLDRLAALMSADDVGVHVLRTSLAVPLALALSRKGLEVLPGEAGPDYVLIRRPRGDWPARTREYERQRLLELTTYGGLTARQADVWVRAETGLSQRAIAAELGVNPSTVNGLLHRAAEALRRASAERH